MKDDLRTLIESLARIPARTGQEAARAAFVGAYLDGIDTSTDAAGNLWAFPIGRGDWRDTLVYDAHLDAVGAGVAARVVERDGRLIGAGVADNAAAAAMLAQFARALAHGQATSAGPVALVFSVGEEGLGDLAGMRQLVADHALPPRMFVAWDLSCDEYSTRAVGSRRYRLRVQGPGGHSWNDFGTPSATGELVRLLAAIEAAWRREAVSTATPLSFNIGAIAGGGDINCLARRAEATFEFRGLSPQALAALDAALTECLLEPADPRAARSLEPIGNRPAAESTLDAATRAWLAGCFARAGLAPREMPRSTNFNIPLAAGWPAVCLGCCRCGNIHREDEYLYLDSLAAGWRLMKAVAAERPPASDKHGTLQRTTSSLSSLQREDVPSHTRRKRA